MSDDSRAAEAATGITHEALWLAEAEDACCGSCSRHWTMQRCRDSGEELCIRLGATYAVIEAHALRTALGASAPRESKGAFDGD